MAQNYYLQKEVNRSLKNLERVVEDAIFDCQKELKMIYSSEIENLTEKPITPELDSKLEKILEEVTVKHNDDGYGLWISAPGDDLESLLESLVPEEEESEEVTA